MRFFIVIIAAFVVSFAQERIVALTPAVTEILFALGVGPQIVATTRYAAFPKEVNRLPKVGGYASIDLERVIALRPTLVVAQELQQNVLRRLRRLGVRVLSVRLDSLQNIKASIETLAKRLGKEHEGRRLLKNITQAKLQAKKLDSPKRVLVVFGLTSDFHKIYVSSTKLFYNDILTICGAKNVIDESYPTQPVLNYEHIVSLNPEAVLLVAPQNETRRVAIEEALQAWYALPIDAAKKQAVYVLQEDFIAIPSHRVAQTIYTICGVL